MLDLSAIPTAHGAPRGQRLSSRSQSLSLTATLSVALGAIWIIDGLLQLQPSQFSSGFAVGIEMNAMAQPSAIAHIELALGRLASTALAPSTILIAAVQLTLGAAMLTRRARPIALLGSIPWALAVWAIGEGFGNLATGYAMLPTGAPGAALAYAVLAALLLLDQRSRDAALLGRDFRYAWSALWLLAAGLQLGSRVPVSLMLRANFNESAGGEPVVLSGMDHRLAEIAGAHAVAVAALLAFVELLLACAPWISRRRLVLFSTFGVLLIFWVAGENLGGIFTGSTNDIGISPLLALITLGAFDSPIPSRSHSGADPWLGHYKSAPPKRHPKAREFVQS